MGSTFREIRVAHLPFLRVSTSQLLISHGRLAARHDPSRPLLVRLWNSGIPISSLISVVCGNTLPWNEIQGQSQRNHNKHGGAVEGRRPSLLSCLWHWPWISFQGKLLPSVADVRLITNGDPRSTTTRCWSDNSWSESEIMVCRSLVVSQRVLRVAAG